MATRQQLRQRLADMMKAAINADNDTPACEHATAYRPATMKVAQCPFVFTQNGRGRYADNQFESFAELLSLELVIIVSAASLGLRGQAEQEADKHITIAQDYLTKHKVTTVDGTIATEQIELQVAGDQGLRIIRFDDGDYFAAIINVNVVNERRVEYEGY